MKKNKRSLLISIHPNYAQKIMDGMKTIELRRRFPDLGKLSKMLIYSTHPVQAVIGYAEIETVHYLPVKKIWNNFSEEASIQRNDFCKYFDGVEYGYAVELKNPVEFKNPLPLDYISEAYGIVPPQSYRYLDNELEDIFDYADAGHKNSTRHKRSHSDGRQHAN